MSMYNPNLCQYCFPVQGNSFQHNKIKECTCYKRDKDYQNRSSPNHYEDQKKSSGIGGGILAGAITGGIIGAGVHQFGKRKKEECEESSHHNHNVLKDIAIGAIGGAITGGIGKAVINKIKNQ